MSLYHHLSIIYDTFPTSLLQLILPPVVLLRLFFLNITATRVCLCVSWGHILLVVPVWLFGVITEYKMVILARTFPASERPISISQHRSCELIEHDSSSSACTVMI